jgi:hypothetical protein
MQKMIAGEAASRPAWDTLETFARAQVQGFIQQSREPRLPRPGPCQPRSVSNFLIGYPYGR